MQVKTKLGIIALCYNNFFRKNPLVLNIELSHACNLNCTYCGRIRNGVKGKLSYEDVVQAIDAVKAPIIYFTGGEPFLFVKDLTKAVNCALSKGKVVIVVTNGTLLPEVLEDFKVDDKDKDKMVLMFSVDGLREANDKIKGQGSFAKVEQGIRKAKELGFRNRWINFTLYKGNFNELEKVVEHFKENIHIFHINMFFDFTGTAEPIDKELQEISDKAMTLKRKKKNILNPYLYFKMWKDCSRGKDSGTWKKKKIKRMRIECTPWGTITRNPSGWKSPCYFIDGEHYNSYEKLMERTDWKFYQKKKAKECQNCLAHCGFEPTIYGGKKLLVKEVVVRVKNRNF